MYNFSHRELTYWHQRNQRLFCNHSRKYWLPSKPRRLLTIARKRRRCDRSTIRFERTTRAQTAHSRLIRNCGMSSLGGHFLAATDQHLNSSPNYDYHDDFVLPAVNRQLLFRVCELGNKLDSKQCCCGFPMDSCSYHLTCN